MPGQQKKVHTCDYAIISFAILQRATHAITIRNNYTQYMLHFIKKEEWGERAMNKARFLYTAAK